MLGLTDAVCRVQDLRTQEFRLDAARARLIANATSDTPRRPLLIPVRAGIRRTLVSLSAGGPNLIFRRRVTAQ
jgi:hypothetical protein